MASVAIPPQYKQPMWGRMDRALKNSFTTSSIIGMLLLIAIFVVPKPAEEDLTLEKMPERFAKLILEKPKPPAAALKLAERLEAEAEAEPEPEVKPKPEQPKPKPKPRRTEKPKVAKNQGQKGRTKAQTEVKKNLQQVQGSLDKVLTNLTTALPASDKSTKSGGSKRRRRGVRTKGGSKSLASVGGVQTATPGDLSGSKLESSGISISAISDLGGDGSTDGNGTGSVSSGKGGGGGDYRSNASLLAVVRRYAAGIQFCYDNQLKKTPGLRGKLVISLTVLANGRVSDAQVVQDTMKSVTVKSCVLAQIKGWQFPEIPEGVVTFKTPFVFTPPE